MCILFEVHNRLSFPETMARFHACYNAGIKTATHSNYIQLVPLSLSTRSMSFAAG